MSSTTVAVRGRYEDTLGRPAKGLVKFLARPAVIYDGADLEFIVGQSRTVHLDATGAFTAALQPTDDPDAIPTGWTYEVQEWIAGRLLRPAFDVDVPIADAGAGIELGDVAPASPSSGDATTWVTLVAFNAAVTAEQAARAAGDAVNAAAVTAEAGARAAAVAAEATARAGADAAEATARAAGDSTNAAAIAANTAAIAAKYTKPGAGIPSGDLTAAVVTSLGKADTSVQYVQAAANPDLLIVGAITRDANGAATSAPVVWPDGSPGTYTATTLNATFLGAVDAYTITLGSPVTRTYTQPTVTRDSTGAVTTRPAIVVT